jgi:biotin carboxylase
MMSEMLAGKTILIVGAGHEQVPAILTAQQLGLRVVTSDRNPAAPGSRVADHFELADTADKNANLRIARTYKANGVMTLGSETAVPVVAFVARELGLPGYSEETAFLATNKNGMRAAFLREGVPAPACAPIRSIDEARSFAAEHGYPIVLKPSDSSGQRGTTFITGADQLDAAYEAAIPFATDGEAVAEEFCEGQEINVTAAVIGGQVHFLSFSDRVTGVPGHFGIAVEHVAPPSISDQALAAVRSACESAIRSIGLENGIAYPQVIATEDGPRVIEIAARIPGGHMREVAMYMSGFDMIEVAILIAMGIDRPLDHCRRSDTADSVCVHFLTELDFDHQGRRIRSVNGVEDALNSVGVRLARLHLTPGERVPLLNSSAGRFGAVLATGATRSEAQRNARAAAALMRVEYVTDGEV